MSGVVDSLEEIKKYLCSGNPVWDVDEVAADVTISMLTVRFAKNAAPNTGGRDIAERS